MHNCGTARCGSLHLPTPPLYNGRQYGHGARTMARTWFRALRKTVAIFTIGITYVRRRDSWVESRGYAAWCGFMRKWQIRIAVETNVYRAARFSPRLSFLRSAVVLLLSQHFTTSVRLARNNVAAFDFHAYASRFSSRVNNINPSFV